MAWEVWSVLENAIVYVDVSDVWDDPDEDDDEDES